MTDNKEKFERWEAQQELERRLFYVDHAEKTLPDMLENVRMLYGSGWWDGPLSGLCEYENKFYWFKVHQEEEYDEEKEEWSDRIYKLIEIDPWQLSYELYWHSIFVSNVYRNSKCRTQFEENLKNERFYMKDDFYKKRKKEHKEIDYSNNNVIGTFKF